MPSDTRRRQQRALRVDCKCANLSVMGGNQQVNAFVHHVVQHLQCAFLLVRQAYDLGDRFFGLADGAEAVWILVGLHLLNQLQGHKVEDEGLLH